MFQSSKIPSKMKINIINENNENISVEIDSKHDTFAILKDKLKLSKYYDIFDSDNNTFVNTDHVSSWLSTLPDGKLYIKRSEYINSYDGNINIQWEIWRIYTTYCVHGGYGIDAMPKQQYVQFLRDCGIITKHPSTLSRAEVDIIYIHECGKKLMNFEHFLGSLVRVAYAFFDKLNRYKSGHTQLYARSKTQVDKHECFHRLIDEYIMNRAPRWAPNQAAIDILKNEDIHKVFEHFRSFLVEVFYHYCGASELMAYNDFCRFSMDFDLGSIGLSSNDLAFAFLQSKQLPVDGNFLHDENRACLELSEFVATLGRIAIIGLRTNTNIKPVDAIKALFMHFHQCRKFTNKERSVTRSGAVHYSNLLQTLFVSMWEKDGRRHYLMANPKYKAREKMHNENQTYVLDALNTYNNNKKNLSSDSSPKSTSKLLKRHRKSSIPMMTDELNDTSPVPILPTEKIQNSGRPTSLSQRYKGIKTIYAPPVVFVEEEVKEDLVNQIGNNNKNNNNNNNKNNNSNNIYDRLNKDDNKTVSKNSNMLQTLSSHKKKEHISKDLSKVVMIGDTFVKFQNSHAGRSSVKYVQVDPEQEGIWWDNTLKQILIQRKKGINKAKRVIKLENILHIKTGHQTQAFSPSLEKDKNVNNDVALRSFSIVTAERSLDLVADSIETANLWRKYLLLRVNELQENKI